MADILFDLLKSQVSDDLVGALAGQLGGASQKQTSTAVDGAMSILLNGLAKNAQSTSGASALGAALDRDHDGSILDDVMGFVTESTKPKNERAANGAGILGHILGGKQTGAIDMLSKMSGLDSNQSTSLLIKMAPIVLGMLGKQKRSGGLSPSDLGGLLSGAAAMSNKGNKNASLITSLLDQDGDGSLKGEAVGFGLKMLKGLFSRKR